MPGSTDRPGVGTDVVLFPSRKVTDDRLLVFPSPRLAETPKSPVTILGQSSGKTRIVSARLESAAADRTAVAVSAGLFRELQSRDDQPTGERPAQTDDSLSARVWSASVLDVIIHGEVGWLAIWAALLAQLAAVGAAVLTFLTTTPAVGVGFSVLAVAMSSATVGAYKDVRAAFRNRDG